MDVSPADILNCFKWQTGQQTVLANTATKVLGADPNRVAILLGNASAGTFVIWFDNTVTANKGFPINQTVVNLQLLFKELGPLVNQEIWTWNTAGGVLTWAWASFTPFVCDESIPEYQ